MGEKKVVILLSDADPVLSRVYKNKFSKSEGWDVFITGDNAEALAIVEKETPHVVITDIVLGSGDGYSLLEGVRSSKNKSVAKTPVVILTNLAQKEDKKKAEKLGVTKYFIKNEISLPDVIAEVKKIVS